MDQKIVLKLLIKIFPLYLLALIIWQYTGVANYYHKLLAAILSFLYEKFDPAGPIKGVIIKEGDFLVKLLASGKKIGLDVTAQDVTSNLSMLVALYFASPIWRYLRRFICFFLSSFFILVVIHLITFYSTIKFALMSNELIVSLFPPGNISIKLVPIYVSFYTNMGMYLFIIILWLPYILSLLMRQKNIHEKQHQKSGGS